MKLMNQSILHFIAPEMKCRFKGNLYIVTKKDKKQARKEAVEKLTMAITAAPAPASAQTNKWNVRSS